MSADQGANDLDQIGESCSLALTGVLKAFFPALRLERGSSAGVALQCEAYAATNPARLSQAFTELEAPEMRPLSHRHARASGGLANLAT